MVKMLCNGYVRRRRDDYSKLGKRVHELHCNGRPRLGLTVQLTLSSVCGLCEDVVKPPTELH